MAYRLVATTIHELPDEAALKFTFNYFLKGRISLEEIETLQTQKSVSLTDTIPHRGITLRTVVTLEETKTK